MAGWYCLPLIVRANIAEYRLAVLSISAGGIKKDLRVAPQISGNNI